MKLPLYWIDAFTDRAFHGNPAAVVPLERWPDDAAMQRIAFENGLSETAFFGQTSLHARQVSARGGELWCTLAGDRVKIAGQAVRYLRGEIAL